MLFNETKPQQGWGSQVLSSSVPWGGQGALDPCRNPQGQDGWQDYLYLRPMVGLTKAALKSKAHSQARVESRAWTKTGLPWRAQGRLVRCTQSNSSCHELPPLPYNCIIHPPSAFFNLLFKPTLVPFNCCLALESLINNIVLLAK